MDERCNIKFRDFLTILILVFFLGVLLSALLLAHCPIEGSTVVLIATAVALGFALMVYISS